jgi:hypothetical protein
VIGDDGLALALWALLASGPAPADRPGVVDCQPCRFQPAKDRPEYEVRFDLTRREAGRLVARMHVRAPGQPAEQVLSVDEMSLVPESSRIQIDAPDIDFDGYRDLSLVVAAGGANATAQYWLFDPKLNQYRSIGQFPVFRLDPRRKRLLTYEKGGMAGLEYESREYAIIDGGPVVVKEEKQAAVDETGRRYRRVTSKRIRGKLVEVKRQIVSAP